MRIVMLGAPGSGKARRHSGSRRTSACRRCRPAISCAARVADKTPLGLKAKAVMDAGELVSDDIVLGMIEERIGKPDAAHGFILDGYPRNGKQAQDLETVLKRRGVTIDAAVLMDVGFDILMKRLTGRRTCSKTAPCSTSISPRPRSSSVQKGRGELLQRDDDKERRSAIGSRSTNVKPRR
jgi:adenylate kinase